jgi:hypothetical protein
MAFFTLLALLTEEHDSFRFGNTGLHFKKWHAFQCKTTMMRMGSSIARMSHRALLFASLNDTVEEGDDAFASVANNRRAPPPTPNIITLQPDNEHDAMLDAVLDVAILASRRAAAIIADNSQGVDVLETKSTSRDLLTRVDPLCEKTIQETVKTYFPHHLFLGEEGVAESGIEAAKAALEEKLEQGGWLWIVDPIDGKGDSFDGRKLRIDFIYANHF